MQPLDIKIETTKNGCTIWVNGRWVMDASTFKDEFTISIDKKHMIKLYNIKELVEYGLDLNSYKGEIK